MTERFMNIVILQFMHITSRHLVSADRCGVDNDVIE